MSTDPRAELERMAEEVAATIRGEWPDMDTSYDLWTEELDGRLYGVVDMGDAFHESYTWEDDGHGWTLAPVDSFTLVDRILRHRAYVASL